MAAAPSISWAQILDQVSASMAQIGDKSSAEVLPLRPSSVTAPLPETADIPARDVSDWMSTLDIINGMGGLADEQKQRLKEQTQAHQQMAHELRRDLTRLTEHVRMSEIQEREARAQAEARLQELQARTEARVQEIRADAEARVRLLQADADARLRAAEERVRNAELRTDTAEKWLKRISEAAKRQLMGDKGSSAPHGL